MQSFMERYLGGQKVAEHRVAIQLMRHTLMHTGALRYLYEPKTGTAYTWRIHFGDTFPSMQFEHYALTTDDLAAQNDLLTSVSGHVTAVKALNLQITQFAADILQVATDYTTKMSTDAALQSNCEGACPAIQVQTLNWPRLRRLDLRRPIRRRSDRLAPSRGCLSGTADFVCATVVST
jgi:hypothetical protein